jgi:nitrite reductase/ring-hydroxylating ferredoxin subunit
MIACLSNMEPLNFCNVCLFFYV